MLSVCFACATFLGSSPMKESRITRKSRPYHQHIGTSHHFYTFLKRDMNKMLHDIHRKECMCLVYDVKVNLRVEMKRQERRRWEIIQMSD